MLSSDDLKEEVLEFFYLFSRFEFALKRAGYWRKNGNNVSPDWGEFVSKYKNIYMPNKELMTLFDRVRENPPSKQVEYLGCIIWKEYVINNKAPDLQIYTDIIRIIRNNLFHGGKYGDRGWDNKERVKFLLDFSCQIIKDISSMDEELKAYSTNFA